ncbi:MAG TPA: class I fructose-bisphosphate aldolase, partial [Gammaproteobacteria bacterium]|nr:class I fructose-bisphosphate aldolase [Gammaproteobacteria bacterium]
PLKASIEQVASETLKILRRTVPVAVPSVNFLSGGQTPQEATAHLNMMHTLFPNLPWNLSYSYARALQDDCLKSWLGEAKNVELAQKALYKRVKLNSLAAMGKYTLDKEKEALVA